MCVFKAPRTRSPGPQCVGDPARVHTVAAQVAPRRVGCGSDRPSPCEWHGEWGTHVRRTVYLLARRDMSLPKKKTRRSALGSGGSRIYACLLFVIRFLGPRALPGLLTHSVPSMDGAYAPFVHNAMARGGSRKAHACMQTCAPRAGPLARPTF